MNVFTRLILFSSLSSVASIGLLTTEAKAFTLSDLVVKAEITSPVNGQRFPNGSVVAGTGIASWAGIISTVDETAPITLYFGYSFQHDGRPEQSGTIPYTFVPGLNLVPVGSGIKNYVDVAGPLSPGTYYTSIGVSFGGKPAGDAHSWYVIPEPLTILGTGVVLGAIPVLKKEYAERKKKNDKDT